MGVITWLRSRLGMPDFNEEQAERLRTWEYAQTNDWNLLETDPQKEEVKASVRLLDHTPEDGFAQLLQLANSGSVFCMNFVAWCYWSGTGMSRDLDQAMAWWRRAYENGSDRGLLEYGACLAGNGRADEAERIYEAGWERGFAPAVYRLIRMRLTPSLPLPARLEWQPSLEWAADEGHPAARYMLGKYLFRGWFGIGGIPRGAKLVCGNLAAIFRGDEDRPIVA